MNIRIVMTLILSFSFCGTVGLARAESTTSTSRMYIPYPGEFVAAVVMAPKTHKILFAYQPDLPHPAASLTKLANAITFVKRNISWDKRVILRKQDEVGGGRLRVSIGSTLTVRDLLYSSITASANNAAMAMARVSGLTYVKFIKQMNTEMKKVGITHSTFVDASGMNPKNITTARDMAHIGEIAFRQSAIRRAAGTSSYRMTVETPRVQKVLKNTNALLTQDPDIWVVGGKTGYIEESMHNLVTQVRPMNEQGRGVLGQDLIVVVLGSQSTKEMFASAKRLANWAWASY